MNFFARRRKPAADTSALGQSLIAMRLGHGDLAPAPCTVVCFNAAGQARRLRSGRVARDESETIYCFHPGPFEIDLSPFAQAPEWGLRLRFLVDAANPRIEQQRFDLYLYSEAGLRLGVADFRDAAQAALRQALAQGSIELPPCTSLEEWNSFRAGLNQLLYTRFGVIVDDCLPIDLGVQVDYAAILRERAARAAPPAAVPAIAAAAAASAIRQSARTAAAPQAGRDAGTVACGRREPILGPAPAPAPAVAFAATLAGTGAPRDEAPLRATAQVHPGAPSSGAAQARAETQPRPDACAGARDMGDRAVPQAQPDAAAAARKLHADAGAQACPAPAAAAAAQGAAAAFSPQADARALRRLFLELPALTGGLRQLLWPPGLELFRQQQELMQRLHLASLDVNTMPSLAWAAPGQALPAPRQARRIQHSMAAAAALDEGWALLACLRLATDDSWTPLLDDADRICANLEHHLAGRRAALGPAGELRKEPAA
ncbi:hypothetical protein ACLB1G_05970 [Oxalobacteraceae bacterium A2-2]